MSRAREYYKAGVEHFAGGRTDDAIAAYREALGENENLAMAWNGLAMALAKNGDLDSAIDAAKRYVELDPEDPLAHTSLSILYQRKGMIPEAEDEKALAMKLQAQGP